MTDSFTLGHVPVNTLVALGTKTKTAGHRSLGSGCIWKKTGVSIENGRAIRILLHRPAALTTTPLLDGDGVNIFNVCGKLLVAHELRLEPSDNSLTWMETDSLPRAATWGVCSTPSGPAAAGQPLEIMQTVFLVHFETGMVVTTHGSGMKFVAVPIAALDAAAENPVPFYFTTPSYLPENKIPPFILTWFPSFRENNTRWLNSWNQTTPLHVHHRQKWNAEVLSRLALEKEAAELMTASEAAAAFKPWSHTDVLSMAPRHPGVLAKTVPWTRKAK